MRFHVLEMLERVLLMSILENAGMVQWCDPDEDPDPRLYKADVMGAVGVYEALSVGSEISNSTT